MKKETIDLLKEIRLGETYPCCKELDEIGIEKQNVLSKLYRMDVLNKTPKGSYKSGNTKLLSKFIELQDFEKLIEFIENESENKSIINSGIYIETNHNKGNQSFDKIEVKKNKTTHNKNPNKKPSIWARIKSFCVKFWWAVIIPLAVIVIGLLIERGIIDIGL